MSVSKKVSQFALAATAAAAFATMPMVATAGDSASSKGHCAGVNACKGKSSCKGADHACKGENACKGKGFVSASEGTCDQLGGEFEEAKS